ncbi:MAG TPA: phage portal protein, partial [Nevskiaceae bacterium]|nr:phage portal protein [Nevskiaceae bacterium]
MKAPATTQRADFDKLNAVDRVIAYFSPSFGIRRQQQRAALAAMRGYESAEPSRKRRFHYNKSDGNVLARMSAVALRDQARHLERNHDITVSILDKLVDFTVGTGIVTQFQPKRRDGSIHTEFAALLTRKHAKWSEWPEVTWTHARGAAERLACRTMYRDGEVLGQMIFGPRSDNPYSMEVPFAIEMMEADLLPYELNNLDANVRQGIQCNAWGRPQIYNVYKNHPGGDFVALTLQTKPIPAENILHPRLVNRIGQRRGITILAPIIARAQDLHEYEGQEFAAAKMAASLVLKMTRGSPDMWDNAAQTYDKDNPPVMQMDGGMVVVQNQQGENTEFFDTKRPNAAVEPFSEMNVRRIAGGVGLSYSAVSRNYNGTYSAQRQELVENWPHYHAMTGIWVAQWNRPADQRFIDWVVLTQGMPADVDPA